MPTLSASNRTQVAYKLEGTYPTNWSVLQGGNGNLVRITGETLDYTQGTEQSKELRSDRQVTDTITVSASAQGGFNFEMSYREFDWRRLCLHRHVDSEFQHDHCWRCSDRQRRFHYAPEGSVDFSHSGSRRFADRQGLLLRSRFPCRRYDCPDLDGAHA